MLEILRLMVPSISRVGMICNPDNSVAATYLRWFEASAGQLGVQPINLPIRDAAGIERAIAGMAEQPNGAILSVPDLTANIHRSLIATLTARHRVPAIYTNSLFADAGGLVAYGANTLDLFRQAASYADRILRGEKAGDLPFQQPTTYRLVINLKTAKALGLDVPPELVARADDVIE